MTAPTDDWNWSNAVGAIWRGRYLIVLVTVLSGVLTAGAMLITPRTYQAVVTVRIGRVMNQPLEDSSHVAAAINSKSIVAQLRTAGFADWTVDGLLDAISATAAGPGGNPFLTIGARARNPAQAVRLSKAVAQIIVDGHQTRYQSILDHQTQYRDELSRQISAIRAEIGDIEAALESIREHPPVAAPGVLLMRAQLEEKQSQLLDFIRELRDVETGIAGQTEQTRMVGEPVVPRSLMRPRRTLNTAAGAAAGALLAIFWVLASDAMRRRPGPETAPR